MLHEPHVLYERMRQQHGPVVPILLDGDVPAWLVLGFHELSEVFRNRDITYTVIRGCGASGPRGAFRTDGRWIRRSATVTTPSSPTVTSTCGSGER
jgi:hypothetical protein